MAALALTAAHASLARARADDDRIFGQSQKPNFRSPVIEIEPGEATAGAQLTYFGCPCFRWSIRAKTLGGKWETREFLISSEALFKYQQTIVPKTNMIASEEFTVGAIEALIKGGRIGLGFEGVTWGKNLDRNYNDIFRTGFYAIFNLIRTSAARLDIRTGYEFEKLRINTVIEQTHHRMPQEVALHVHTDTWGANVTGMIEYNPFEAGSRNTHGFSYKASASIHAKVLSLKNLMISLGFGISYERDAHLADLGITPELATAGLFVNVSYEPLPISPPRKKAK